MELKIYFSQEKIGIAPILYLMSEAKNSDTDRNSPYIMLYGKSIIAVW